VAVVRRLCRAALPGLPGAVRRPDFDPAAIGTGIVHLGIGAFARAHLAGYTQPLLREDPGWGILGVSLRRADTRDALAGQDWLYTCAERDSAGERLTVMGALTGVLVAPEAPGAVVARLADPAVRIVTLTVTEKGYHRDGASGGLDANDPAIRHRARAAGCRAASAGCGPRAAVHRAVLRQSAGERSFHAPRGDGLR
jgi:fructuronate reductase